MRRARRNVELTLLLAVAPLVACGGAEERHCVGPDGVYLGDACCEERAPCYAPGAHYVYVPHRYYGGAGSHAGSWRSATSPSRGAGSVARGGFGSTGGGHGVGGHGGGS